MLCIPHLLLLSLLPSWPPPQCAGGNIPFFLSLYIRLFSLQGPLDFSFASCRERRMSKSIVATVTTTTTTTTATKQRTTFLASIIFAIILIYVCFAACFPSLFSPLWIKKILPMTRLLYAPTRSFYTSSTRVDQISLEEVRCAQETRC